MKPQPLAARTLVWMLRLLAFLLGLTGFLLLLLWVTQSLGLRPVLTLPLFGPSFQAITTDDGYILGWTSASGLTSTWVLPAGSFEPLGALIACVGSAVAWLLNKAVERWLGVNEPQQPKQPTNWVSVNTEGGDYAEGNIDKRQGFFVENSIVHGDVVRQQVIHQQPPPNTTVGVTKLSGPEGSKPLQQQGKARFNGQF